jgi:hypothetical protein
MTQQLPPLKWAPSPNYSARGAKVDLIVIHDCEGSYTSAVSWFGQKASQVSAHVVLKEDGTEASQCVDFGAKAWHAMDFNSRSIGIEMGGFAARGFPEVEWDSCARVTAYLLRAYGLPASWAHGGQGAGFTSHYDLGRAGGGHSDPTRDVTVWQSFVNRVQAAYAGVRYDPSAPWGRGLPKAAPVAAAPSSAPAAATAQMSVSEAQAALNKLGYKPVLVVDGVAGPKTRDAIAKFQRSRNLFGSGALDARTAAALRGE